MSGKTGGVAPERLILPSVTIHEGTVKNADAEVQAYKGVVAFFAKLFGVAVQIPLGGTHSITVNKESARAFFKAHNIGIKKDEDIVKKLTLLIAENKTAQQSVEDVLNLRGAEANEFEKQIFTDVSKGKLLYTPESTLVSKDVFNECFSTLQDIGIDLSGVNIAARERGNHLELSAKDFEAALKKAQVDQNKFGNIEKVQDKELKRFLSHMIEMVSQQRAGIVGERRAKERKLLNEALVDQSQPRRKTTEGKFKEAPSRLPSKKEQEKEQAEVADIIEEGAVSVARVRYNDMSEDDQMQVIKNLLLSDLNLRNIQDVKGKLKQLIRNDIIKNNISEFHSETCKMILRELGITGSSGRTCEAQILTLGLFAGLTPRTDSHKEAGEMDTLLKQLVKRSFARQ